MRRRVAARVLTKKGRVACRAAVRARAEKARAVAALRGRGSQDDLMRMVGRVGTVVGVAETGVGVQVAVLASAAGRNNRQIASVLVGKAAVSVGGLKGTWSSGLVRAYDRIAIEVVGRQAISLAGARVVLSKPFAGIGRGANAVAYADEAGRVGVSVGALVLVGSGEEAACLVAVLADASSAARSGRASAFAARYVGTCSGRGRRGACSDGAA